MINTTNNYAMHTPDNYHFLPERTENNLICKGCDKNQFIKCDVYASQVQNE